MSRPKGKQQGTLNIREVIRVGYQHGMVESTALSVDDVWSALKFTFPKEGSNTTTATANCLHHSALPSRSKIVGVRDFLRRAVVVMCSWEAFA